MGKVQPNLKKELKLKMVTQRITLLFAICSFANSLPSSSNSKSKGSSSNSWPVNKTSKGLSSTTSNCCSSTSPVAFETTGMGSFYQGERLGTYEAVGQSSDGRSMYKQKGGDNFLFFLAEAGVWMMMGPEPGRDFGGVLNRGSGSCPEELTSAWEYYVDWTDSWDEDSWMEVTCSDNNQPTSPPGEPCTWGSYCDDCDIWSEANGVRYCCAVDVIMDLLMSPPKMEKSLANAIIDQ